LKSFHIFWCPFYFKCYEPTLCNKLITNKRQLQRTSCDIFLDSQKTQLAG
jgi:hypothetical protein